jgi:hypothetical protein
LYVPFAEGAAQRAELFRELMSVRQEYGMLLRIARSRRALRSKIAAPEEY